MRCLIVDDDPVCRKVLCAALRAYGAVEEAVTGRDAVEAVRVALVAKRPFHLITLDIMLPDMDGQTALSAIRETELMHGVITGSAAKIFVSSSLAAEKTLSSSFREQCTDYINKPIDLEKMFLQLKAHGLIPA